MQRAAAYDAIAQWYDAQLRDVDGLLPFHELAIPTLLELAGDVLGREVCDLACGQGIASRELARRGARVVGVDLSPLLLEIARHEEEAVPLGIAYLRDDAHALVSFADDRFDMVTCNLALMDIPDLSAVFLTVHRVLRSGGAFVFAITHPCLIPPGSRWTDSFEGGPGRHVRGYFTEGYSVPPHAPGVRGRVGTYHRTLTTYLNMLVGTGFALERIAEPRASGLAAERQPGATEAPLFFGARFTKRRP